MQLHQLTDARDNIDGLFTGSSIFPQIVRRYKVLGFDRAFGPGTDPQVDIDCLKEDLGLN